jgi:glutathione peroxidase
MTSRPGRLLAATAALLALALPGGAAAKKEPRGRDIHSFSAKSIDGKEVPLARYRGKALLVVNTASRCGFTKQYASLEKLYDRYRDRGFEVLAFPANNFMNQEPGSNAEIQEFCTVKYGASFPLFEKISVKGRGIAPLYAWLTKDSGFPGDIEWNFAKFLVGPDGKVAARFAPRVDPLSPEVIAKLEEILPPSK